MTGVRVCLKELYATKYDPLSISYTVLSGRDTNHLLVLVFPLSAMYEFCPHVVLRSEIYQKKKKMEPNYRRGGHNM